MNKTVKVDKLIERFVDMAKRDALLVNASKDDLVTQIIGTHIIIFIWIMICPVK